MAELAGLFAPSRVAVVGATDRSGAVGRAITENLLADFEGEVVPVNPNRETVLGRPCVDDLAAAGAVDLAVVVVPPEAAVEVVTAAGEAGIRNVVVITAGFGETGAEGARRERELRAVATAHDINLVGPNCLGIISTPVGLNATFGPTNALPGSLSLMSQSGAFITAVLDWAREEGLGFKDVVSLGNKAVLDEVDFVEAWGADPDTDVILGYLEGIEDGRAFIDRAREVTAGTPIVLLKAGRTAAGAKAAASHTGAIAGSDRAYAAGLDQAGVIRARTVGELFDVARALEALPLPPTEGVGVVTNAGGPGVITTDSIGDAGLKLAGFADATVEGLTDALPETANVHNPVDVIGDADVERFRRALDLVLEDPNVGAGIVLSAPTAVLTYEALAEAVAACQREHGKPVVTCLMGGERVAHAEPVLREAGIPNYFDPDRAVRSLEALVEYRAVREREYASPARFDVDRERARAVLDRGVERGEHRLGVEAMDLLSAYGIPTPAGGIAGSPGEAADLAAGIDGDVVLKIVSPDILHKSDIGGVRVGVPTPEVPDAFESLVTRARNYHPDATVLGVQVQERLDTDAGVETICGVSRDPQFGPLLMFGLGGVFVEVFKDTTFRVAPISEREARTMTEEIDAAPLLRGARGRDPVAIEAVVETLGRLSQLATDFPAILELDVNPLLATPDGVSAVDLRLTLDRDALTEGPEPDPASGFDPATTQPEDPST